MMEVWWLHRWVLRAVRMGRRLFRWLPPAEEVGEDFGYSYRSISSPALSGWKLRALLFLLESPLSTPLRNLLYRRSDTVQVRWF